MAHKEKNICLKKHWFERNNIIHLFDPLHDSARGSGFQVSRLRSQKATSPPFTPLQRFSGSPLWPVEAESRGRSRGRVLSPRWRTWPFERPTGMYPLISIPCTLDIP